MATDESCFPFGPAGIACAVRLLEAGHSVTIFDKSKEFGGMISSVIPQDRQESSFIKEIKAVFQDVPADRLVLELGTELSEGLTLDTIVKRGFDAAFIGLGLPRSTPASAKRGGLPGLWDALNFLNASRHAGGVDVAGRSVAVVGGGNTAMDAAVTAKQLGAKDVYVIYRRSFEQMPAWPAERNRALEMGIHFLILTQQLDYIEKDGRVTGMKVCPTRLGAPDASGRRTPEPVASAAYVLGVDVVIEAVGQEAPANLDKLLPGVALERGRIKVNPQTFQTSRPGVFAGGDLVRGASTVVAAVADGMKAAREIDIFLRNKGEQHAG